VAAPAAISSCQRDQGLTPPARVRAEAAPRAIPPAAPPPPPVTRPPLPETEPIVRVCVKRWRGGPFNSRIGPDSTWIGVGSANLDRSAVVFRAPLQVSLSQRGWSITDAGGLRLSLARTQAVHLARPKDEDQLIHVDGQAYPGSIMLHGRADAGATPAFDPTMGDEEGDGAAIESASADHSGWCDVVNHVALEAYLPGVISRELYNNWQRETHAAQAVAARSFACVEQAWFASRRHYDLTNTQASQAYAGKVNHRTSLDAVAATRGAVLAYGGLLLPAYYSSCCGGPAARAIDAIGSNPINDAPPLEGRKGEDVCATAPSVPHARWRNEQSVQAVTRRLNACGAAQQSKPLAGLGLVKSFAVIARNPHGRPTRYRIEDASGGYVEIGAETLRRAINFTGQGLHAPKEPLKSSNFAATVASGKVIFDGRGYGHGVGMCQYGAEALAKAGRDHRAILEWYYPGADITVAYAANSAGSAESRPAVAG
jgi:stage II sporulation protein D